ncbi:hypothetical protein [Streptomyces sp. NPDC087300]|uniref:hypothetical protein n=1 Tax=Streptomyces sp. NPDC087300 TaxID=3365780 RepID=UPI0037FC211E
MLSKEEQELADAYATALDRCPLPDAESRHAVLRRLMEEALGADVSTEEYERGRHLHEQALAREKAREEAEAAQAAVPEIAPGVPGALLFSRSSVVKTIAKLKPELRLSAHSHEWRNGVDLYPTYARFNSGRSGRPGRLQRFRAVADAIKVLAHRQHSLAEDRTEFGTIMQSHATIAEKASELLAVEFPGFEVTVHQVKRIIKELIEGGALVLVRKTVNRQVPLYALTVPPHVEPYLTCTTPGGRGRSCHSRKNAEGRRVRELIGLVHTPAPVAFSDEAGQDHEQGCPHTPVDESAPLSRGSRREPREVLPYGQTLAGSLCPASAREDETPSPSTEEAGKKITRGEKRAAKAAKKYPAGASLFAAPSLATHRYFLPLTPQASIRVLAEAGDAGWTADDVVRALGEDPAGNRWNLDSTIKKPASVIAWRLDHWRRPDGTLLPSPAQERAEKARQDAQRDRQAAAERATRDMPLVPSTANPEFQAEREAARVAARLDPRARRFGPTPAEPLNDAERDAQRAAGPGAQTRAAIRPTGSTQPPVTVPAPAAAVHEHYATGAAQARAAITATR